MVRSTGESDSASMSVISGASMSVPSVAREVVAAPGYDERFREASDMKRTFKKPRPLCKTRAPIVPDHVVTGFYEPKGPSPKCFTDVHMNYLGQHGPTPQGLRPPEPN